MVSKVRNVRLGVFSGGGCHHPNNKPSVLAIKIGKICRMTTASLLILLALLHLATSHSLSSLTFGIDTSSYILMQPDLTPIQEEFSICAWIKRVVDHNYSAQFWLSYVASANYDEIVISDAATCWLFGDSTTYTAPSKTTGEWHHICTTFSYSSLTKRVYYDGVQIGSESTPSGRKLNVPGSLMFGQLHKGYGGGNIKGCCYFGGTMFGTTIYSTELSSDQVQEMYTQGRCSNFTEILSDVTFLSWQDILKEERHGNVVEHELEECDTDHAHPAEDEDTDHAHLINSTSWQFLRGEYFLNKEITKDMISGMTGRLDILGEFQNHTIDDVLIKHLKKHHTDTDLVNETEDEHGAAEEDGVEEGEEEEEEDGEEEDNMTDSLNLPRTDSWKFLTDIRFYNKVVNNDLISGMKERLELLAEFCGHLCDEFLIEHLEKHHA